MIILLTDQHSPRRSMPEIKTLTTRDLSWKYLPISIRHSAISKGESLLILFKLHQIIRCFKYETFRKLSALQKTFSARSPPISKFSVLLKYFFHTLPYRFRPTIIGSLKRSDWNGFYDSWSSLFCYILLNHINDVKVITNRKGEWNERRCCCTNVKLWNFPHCFQVNLKEFISLIARGKKCGKLKGNY